MIRFDHNELGMGAKGTEGVRNETLTTGRLSLDNEMEVNLWNGEKVG